MVIYKGFENFVKLTKNESAWTQRKKRWVKAPSEDDLYISYLSTKKVYIQVLYIRRAFVGDYTGVWYEI